MAEQRKKPQKRDQGELLSSGGSHRGRSAKGTCSQRGEGKGVHRGLPRNEKVRGGVLGVTWLALRGIPARKKGQWKTYLGREGIRKIGIMHSGFENRNRFIRTRTLPE